MKITETYIPIDFSVSTGKRRGMSINLVPGFGHPDKTRVIGMDDRAFYIVEYFLPKEWMLSSGYDHFGVCVFPKPIWDCISLNITRLYQVAEDEVGREELSQIVTRYSELNVDREHRGEVFWNQMIAFLGELISALESWGGEFDNVYFYGL